LKIVWVADLLLDVSLHKTSRLQILSGLSKRGHDTTLLAVRSKRVFNINANNAPSLYLFPLRYITSVEPFLFSFLLIFFLPIYILYNKPNFVILEPEFSIIASIPSLLISKLTTSKFVLDIRSTPVELFGASGTIKHFIFSLSVVLAKKFFSGITIITPMMREEVARKYVINPKKIGVWTTGVDLELFNPIYHSHKGNELREKFGLMNSFVVFYHGHLSTGRGLIEVIKAIKLLSEIQPGYVLFLIGSGPSTNMLKSFVENSNLQGTVIIHKPVDYRQVPDFISIADVCIVPLADHPDWRNQCSFKLLEYLSMEKVVIATCIPAHTVITGDSPCSQYIQSIDPETIAKAIESARKNQEKLNNWGKYGRTIVSLNYTWEKVAKDFESYLYSILN
jgi:glycosyltransferase involved in cell wall biosynthesis